MERGIVFSPPPFISWLPAFSLSLLDNSLNNRPRFPSLRIKFFCERGGPAGVFTLLPRGVRLIGLTVSIIVWFFSLVFLKAPVPFFFSYPPVPLLSLVGCAERRRPWFLSNSSCRPARILFQCPFFSHLFRCAERNG